MSRSLRGVRNLLRPHQPARRGDRPPARYVRPGVEALEDRLTPAPATVAASGVISGVVLAAGGSHGLPGVVVTLTGDTATGRTVDVTATTDGNGAYAFTDLLPGTYSVSRGSIPDGFIGGNVTLLSNVVITQGQSSDGNDLAGGGLSPNLVSLALFISGPSAQHAPIPAGGTGTAAGFSLDGANTLTDQALRFGGSTVLDLAGFFGDPDATDTTVTFDTSQGQIKVELFDKDAPQTVANFLDYMQAGAYNSDLFHRMVNLTTQNVGSPEIIQGGGFSVTTDNSGNVTGLPALTTIFHSILGEFDPAHPDAPNTLAMALTNFPGTQVTNPNSATNGFFFNLTDNSSALGTGNGPFTVFGRVTDSTSQANLAKFAANYKATDVSAATGNAALNSVPLINGFTPASNFPTGATTADLAVINGITVTTPSLGHLTYTVLTNSNPSVVSAALGHNTAGSPLSANQLQLVANAAGSAVITIQVTDARGESVIVPFTVTVP
jgi:cyclophilin family peptidyl-prolyl cis-trans isomerase